MSAACSSRPTVDFISHLKSKGGWSEASEVWVLPALKWAIGSDQPRRMVGSIPPEECNPARESGLATRRDVSSGLYPSVQGNIVLHTAKTETLRSIHGMMSMEHSYNIYNIAEM